MTFQRPQAAVLARRLASRAASSRSWPDRGRSARPRWSSRSAEAGACRCVCQRRRAHACATPSGSRSSGRPRACMAGAGRRRVLVLDEVQKITGWSETVKRLWDEDTRARRPLKVVLLGSAPLLVQQGLIREPRRPVRNPAPAALVVRRDARGVRLRRSSSTSYFGGYPGAAPLVGDPERWRRYVLDSLIETTISRDVLLLTRVDKPALLRRLFELGCRYSGQVLSYTKMLGQLQDAGNTTTLAHYLDLLSGAGMLDRPPEVRRQSRAPARLEPQAPGAQHRADDARKSGLTLDEARSRPRVPGPARRVGGGRAPGERRGGGRMRALLLARTQPRGGLRVRSRPASRPSRSRAAARRSAARARRVRGGIQAPAHAARRRRRHSARGVPCCSRSSTG